MTVLRNGHGSRLICDACGRNEDRADSPTFARYQALTFLGWTRGTPGNRGLRCPSCVGRAHTPSLGHLQATS